MTLFSTCAFVFARGGSKGLPLKNILPLAGLPLLVYSIKIARELDSLIPIYVSTDCPDIARIAEAYGASIIDRPAELASDTASEWLAWQHAVQYVVDNHGPFDRFLSLPPTAPLRNVIDVQRCVDSLTNDVDIVLTMTPARRNPWFNMVVADNANCVHLINGTSSHCRRQDSPECFDLTTVAYVAHPSFILKSSGIWDGVVRGVEIPTERALDIDTPLDYEIARYLVENKNLNSIISSHG